MTKWQSVTILILMPNPSLEHSMCGLICTPLTHTLLLPVELDFCFTTKHMVSTVFEHIFSDMDAALFQNEVKMMDTHENSVTELENSGVGAS